MRDYSVYDITPPSLFILANGPNIYMCGMSEDERTKIKNIYENAIYDSEIAFYYNENQISDDTVAWTEIAIQRAHFVIVNIENVSATEQYLIDNTLTNDGDDDIVIYYSKSGLNSTMARLLASNGEIVIFNLNELEVIIKEIIESDQ